MSVDTLDGEAFASASFDAFESEPFGLEDEETWREASGTGEDRDTETQVSSLISLAREHTSIKNGPAEEGPAVSLEEEGEEGSTEKALHFRELLY